MAITIEEKDMKNNPIYYVSAHHGKLLIELKDGKVLPLAADAQDVALAMAAYGVSANGKFSSSMDFADEFGFENSQGAHVLWDEGRKLYLSVGTKESA